MNTFAQSILNNFKGAIKASRTFPASIGCAFAFALVTAVRIQLNWVEQEPFNFLFNCLHWSLAFGAIFGLASVTASHSRFNTAKASLLANLISVTVAASAFLILYFISGTQRAGYANAVISEIAAVRISSAMLVSFIAFIVLTAYPKDESSFAQSFFMTHKAFFIALIYGAVLLAGTTGVARAIQSLLYRDMSEKVYMYIGTIVGFITFTIFIGYFPDFRKDNSDGHREVAQTQPRFIKILFGSIMTPIVLALTVVLLAWAGKTVLGGMEVSFTRLFVVSASYTIGGLWLHAMVTTHDSALTKFYRRVYPIASIVILIFEAWALVNQLQNSGLKITEYIFIIIWILAAAGSVLLLIKVSEPHKLIAALACILATLSVLPIVGYNALPVNSQIRRLESLLLDEGILLGGELTPTVSEPDQDVRAAITDAVDYLANVQDAKLPGWFTEDLNDSNIFNSKLGFEKTWIHDDDDYTDEPTRYLGTYLSLTSAAIDISDYQWAVNPYDEYKYSEGYAALDGNNGSYQIYWTLSGEGIPSIKILLDERLILEQDMKSFIDALCDKYPPGLSNNVEAGLEDMSLRLETPEIKVLLIFNYIGVNVDTVSDSINYWAELKYLYLSESQ